jgi:hypothetical protein
MMHFRACLKGFLSSRRRQVELAALEKNRRAWQHLGLFHLYLIIA